MSLHAAAKAQVPAQTTTVATDPNLVRPTARSAVKYGLRRNIRISLIEGGAFSLMVGMGETYLPAFVLWMGLGKVASGLITTIPLLLGSLLQLIAPAMVQRLGSYKKWVLFCAVVQGLIFLPLIGSALSGWLPLWLVFLAATIYWGAGLGASGAWNSWMGTIIPCQVQVGFFTKRTRLTQAMVFVGFAIAGVVLHQGPEYFPKSWAYVAIFAGAFLCRLVSVSWLRTQTEPVPPPKAAAERIGLRAFAHRLHRGHEQGKLFSYLLSVTFAAHLAAPYFTSYMLGEMQLAYSSYAILIACSYLGKVLMLPVMGRIAARRGTRPVLLIGGLGIIVLPVLWLVSHRVPYLMGVQAISGIAWGAYELASLLLIWELVRPEERTSAMTIFNIGNSAAMTAGSLLGGVLLWKFGSGATAFAIVFTVSTLARATTVVWLRGISSHRLHWFPVGFRTLTLRPSFGSITMPILSQFKKWSRGRRKDV